MTTRNVIFDFGGVLIRWKPQEIIDAFYPDQASRDALRELVFQHPDWLDLDAGHLMEEDAIPRSRRGWANLTAKCWHSCSTSRSP
jgi:hypothetical protein